MLHFIDFEVFKYDWLCVIINPYSGTKTRIVNDTEALKKYYSDYKKEIFVGYNIRRYDQFIFKALLLDINPKKVNDAIIVDGKKGFEISNMFYKIPLRFYDAQVGVRGLKTLEAFMGHNIHETGVPFDIDRKLTDEEIEETFGYCEDDVLETMNVFMQQLNEFKAIFSLIKAFNLPLDYISKTKAQLSAIILDCKKKNRKDEWELQCMPTIEFVTEKYAKVKDWFLSDENHSYDSELNMEVAGVPHKFKWGGLHGAVEKIHETGNIWHLDVDAFYPSMMIEYGLLSRSVENPDKFKQIRDQRIVFKRSGNPLNYPYKIVINGTFGISKDKYSSAYDPRNSNMVCVNGQLFLLDLIEKLELGIDGFQLLQSNTDGLIVKIPYSQTEKMLSICSEWEERTSLSLAKDEIDEIWQKDVNNYIFRFKESGELETKGAYVKNNNPLDNDLPILNEALRNYLVYGISPERTIYACDELIKFQKVVKVSSKYNCAYHNGEKLSEKTFRVFASKNKNDGYIGKQKSDSDTIEKFGNTPEKVFIYNDSVVGVAVPEYLDKEWYVNSSWERIHSFVG